MTPERARELLEAFQGRRVVLVGDLMMDEWVFGAVRRISPEAPIPVVIMPLTDQARAYKPGGAGNVAAILLGLGAQVRMVGVVGDDDLGGRLVADLEGRGADISGVLVDPSRPTTHKMRILAGRQQLLRIDTEETEPLADSLASQLQEHLRSALSDSEAVLVSDYAKGVISEASLPGELIGAAREAGVPFCVDPKPQNIELFRGAYVVSPNEAEALEAVGAPNSARITPSVPRAGGDSSSAAELPPELLRAGRLLRERLQAEAVFITRGDQGIAVFPRGESVGLIPALSFSPPSAGATAVGDGTGCGDAASAAAALALAAGGDFWEAAELANAAGGIVSRFVGVYLPRPAEILAAFGPIS